MLECSRWVASPLKDGGRVAGTLTSENGVTKSFCPGRGPLEVRPKFVGVHHALEASNDHSGLVHQIHPRLRNKVVGKHCRRNVIGVRLETGLGEARNSLVATAGVGVIAVGGEVGTLSEIAFALRRGLPVVSLGSWRLEGDRLQGHRAFFRAETPQAAVETLLEAIG